MRHIAFGTAPLEKLTLAKRADRDRKKALVERKSLLEGQEMSFNFCQGAFVEIGIDFLQLWAKTDALVGWFHTIGGSVHIIARIASPINLAIPHQTPL